MTPNGYLRVCHHNITGCQCTSDPDCQHDFQGGLVVYGYMAEVPERPARSPKRVTLPIQDHARPPRQGHK